MLAIRRPLTMSLFVAVFFLCAVAQALDPAKALNQYVRDSWQTEHGLPQNSVNQIVQTPDGYIWLATEEGLVRFDGVHFTLFDRSTNAIPRNSVRALAVAPDGSLWIGTTGGVARFVQGSWTSYTTQDGSTDYTVSLFADREERLWVGSVHAGVRVLQRNHWTSYGTGDGLPNRAVQKTYEDREGNVWLGFYRGGLARFRDGKFTLYTRSDGLPSETVRCIYEDRAGHLWISTQGGGLTQWTDGKFTTEPLGVDNQKIVVLSMLEDRDGNFWVGTEENGVRRRRNGAWEEFPSGDRLSARLVNALFEDREGEVWIGIWGGGLNRLSDGKFTTIGREEGLSHNSVFSLFEDRERRRWIGAANGLNRLEPDGSVTLYKRDAGLPADFVGSFWEDRDGALWLGTDGGLSCFKNGRLTSYGSKEGLPTGKILSLAGASDGGIWIGTQENGLYKLKDGQSTSFPNKDGSTSKPILSLLEDHDGVLWVGTTGGGLYRLEKDRLIPEPKASVLSRDFIDVLYEDRQGNLWIGTDGSGLGRYRAGHLTLYSKREGLFNDDVFQILEDDAGYLWMGCNRGISRVRKKDFDAFDSGEISSLPYVSFGHADGMRNVECNGSGQPSGFKSQDGRLWFATEGGVAVIDPARLGANRVSPPVSIEEVLADGQALDQRQGARLLSGSRRLEIHYTALSFADPSKVKFRYRLEGFDGSWVEAGTRRVAYYTNLPAGKHRFQVVACNNDGVWNKAGSSWSFEILPKFYETWEFGVLVGALLITGAWGLHRMQVNQVKARFAAVLAERGRLAREIHDTLAQGFAGISIHLESVVETLERAPLTARQHLDQARGLVRTSLAEARRSVSDLRALALERGDIVQALRVLAEQLTAGTGVATAVEVLGQQRDLPPAVEHNLLRIGQEALTNAIKHGRARTITTELAFDRNRVRLSVRDNGCGFDSKEILTGAGGHFGILGMRERIAQLAGELTVQSAPGQGTEIVVLLPVA